MLQRFFNTSGNSIFSLNSILERNSFNSGLVKGVPRLKDDRIALHELLKS